MSHDPLGEILSAGRSRGNFMTTQTRWMKNTATNQTLVVDELAQLFGIDKMEVLNFVKGLVTITPTGNNWYVTNALPDDAFILKLMNMLESIGDISEKNVGLTMGRFAKTFLEFKRNRTYIKSIVPDSNAANLFAATVSQSQFKIRKDAQAVNEIVEAVELTRVNIKNLPEQLTKVIDEVL